MIAVTANDSPMFAPKLAVRETLNLRLRDTSRFTDFADGGAIPAVEVRAALLCFVQLGRVHDLQELAPAQMNVKVRPVNEGTVGVNLEILQRSRRLAPKGRDGSNWDVQHPMLRTSNEKSVPDKVGVDDTAPDAVLSKGGADAPE